jgi:hypothetical protein
LKLGDQVRLKKKSWIGYCEKKSKVSDTIDQTMPTVVRIAMDEAAIKRPSTAFSTRLRARKSLWARVTPQKRPKTASARTSAVRTAAPQCDISR